MRQIRNGILAAATALAMASAAQAGVTADQAARLGKDLTPVGAETAGNKDNTIPAWTGGITRPPAGYRAGMFHPDPFAADKPLFAITPQNAKDYSTKLTPGQLAMFAKYKTFKMNIYPTRRSASFPQEVYNATLANATSRSCSRAASTPITTRSGSRRVRLLKARRSASPSRFRRTASSRCGTTS